MIKVKKCCQKSIFADFWAMQPLYFVTDEQTRKDTYHGKIFDFRFCR